jgi:hypothetical protein
LKLDRCDSRPRLFINGNRDGTSCTWSHHPAGRGQFAGSLAEAITAGLDGLGDTDAVILWSPKPPP